MQIFACLRRVTRFWGNNVSFWFPQCVQLTQRMTEGSFVARKTGLFHRLLDCLSLHARFARVPWNPNQLNLIIGYQTILVRETNRSFFADHFDLTPFQIFVARQFLIWEKWLGRPLFLLFFSKNYRGIYIGCCSVLYGLNVMVTFDFGFSHNTVW